MTKRKKIIYRKKQYNIDTLIVNAIETSKTGSLSSKVVDNPRKSRKRGTHLSE